MICDNTRIRNRTGWKTTFSLEESLRDVLEYWREEFRRGQTGT